MGYRDNQPLQTLATKGNAAPLAAGNTVFSLADGQIGLFDATTNLSVDGSGSYKEVYFAVGIHSGGAIADVRYSKPIQPTRVDSVTFRPHTPGRNQVSVLYGFCGLCDAEFTLKILVENQKVFRNQGFVQFGRTFAVKTPCCGPCSAPTTPSGDCNVVAKAIVDAINSDESGIFSAAFVTVNSSGVVQTTLTGADIDTFIATEAAAELAVPGSRECAGVQISANEDKIRTNLGLNRNYFYPRGYSFQIIPSAGFACNHTIVHPSLPAYAEGLGADLEHQEYINMSNNAMGGSAYYTSNTTVSDIERPGSLVNPATLYDQIIIENTVKSDSGWLEYENAVGTVIAIPESDTVTLDAIDSILDALFANSGLKELTTDIAAANHTETTVEPTSGKAAGATGITD